MYKTRSRLCPTVLSDSRRSEPFFVIHCATKCAEQMGSARQQFRDSGTGWTYCREAVGNNRTQNCPPWARGERLWFLRKEATPTRVLRELMSKPIQLDSPRYFLLTAIDKRSRFHSPATIAVRICSGVFAVLCMRFARSASLTQIVQSAACFER